VARQDLEGEQREGTLPSHRNGPSVDSLLTMLSVSLLPEGLARNRARAGLRCAQHVLASISEATGERSPRGRVACSDSIQRGP
jgi:hypothetical protein